MSYLKMASKEISNNYIKLFELDFENSYYFFKENAPLFIYAILMNEQLRDLLLKKGEIKIDLTKYFILDNTTKINAFLDKDFVISFIFVLASLGGLAIILIWFIENWQTKIL